MPHAPTGPFAIHYVFRVGDRKASYDFYTKTLLMHVIRHEEFEGGCAATCNGPYSGNWSKTMIGYGHEKEHFVLELTYNYGIGGYDLGNDYEAIHIEHDQVYNNLKGSAEKGPENSLVVHDPEGHKFFIHPGKTELPFKRVSLNASNLAETKKFWEEIVGMKEVSSSDHNAVLTYGPNQCQVEIRQLPAGVSINRGTAFGRFAIAYPTEWQEDTQKRIEAINPDYIQTRRVKLDTPGKESVYVIVLRDPNQHEIAFVSATEMWALSEQIDHDGDKLLTESIANDKSSEWFEKKGQSKPKA